MKVYEENEVDNYNNEDNFTEINNNKISPVDNKSIYYTQFNIKIFIFFIIFFILCSITSIGLFILYLNGNDIIIYYSIIPIIILIIITIISSFSPIFNKIIVDKKNELIIIIHIKILFCFNKYLYINMNDIEIVSIEKNNNIYEETTDIRYDSFNLIFKIKKDKKIIGIYGEIDKNDECQKLFEFLRQSLPKYIQISSDLSVINELYPNIKTNRVMSSSSYNYMKINKEQGNTALSFE